MIKANELRIGNWLKVYGEFTEVMDIGTDKCWSCFWSEAINVEYFEPIPLTPEILEKCGFDGHDSMNDFKLQDWHLNHWKDYNSWILLNRNGSDFIQECQ